MKEIRQFDWVKARICEGGRNVPRKVIIVDVGYIDAEYYVGYIPGYRNYYIWPSPQNHAFRDRKKYVGLCKYDILEVYGHE